LIWRLKNQTVAESVENPMGAGGEVNGVVIVRPAKRAASGQGNHAARRGSGKRF
jgi:hypothetical protein